MSTQARTSSQQLANGLGWFSVGLGLAELVTPNIVAKIAGVSGDSKTNKILRFYGARELAAGIGILSGVGRPAWLWARVAGDAVDLSSLGKAMASSENNRALAIASTIAVTGVTVADVCCAMQLTNQQNGEETSKRSAPIVTSVIIDRSPSEVYAFWRDFTRLPEIVDRLESVQALEGGRSHWKLAVGMGRTLEWDAQTTADEPNSRIAWESQSSSTPHSGEVCFEEATGRRGTKVTVRIRPHGLGPTLSKLVGFAPEQQVRIALGNLKQLLETGEIAKSDASIHRGMHAAQPPEQYPSSGRAMAASV